MSWLIVTDPDGTLLDDRCAAADAGAAIDALAAARPDATIALVSSRTPAEMIDLVGACRSDPVLIFENGSGMAWREAALCRPGASRLGGWELDCCGLPYTAVVDWLQTVRFQRGYAFRAFSEMTADEAGCLMGVGAASAARAMMRLSSEPIVWQDTEAELDRFRADLCRDRLAMVSVGRFLHVGSHVDRGRALGRLWRLIRFQFGIRATTVACGVQPNDLSMMERADHAIVFQRPEGGYLSPANPNTHHAPVAGPAAWLEAVSVLLDQHRDDARAPPRRAANG